MTTDQFSSVNRMTVTRYCESVNLNLFAEVVYIVMYLNVFIMQKFNFKATRH